MIARNTSVLLALGFLPWMASAAPNLEVHSLKWFVHDSFGTLQDAQALVARAMGEADLTFQGDQGSDIGQADVACCSGFAATSVELFSDPDLDEISSEGEFDQLDTICADAGGGACAFLVQVLDWCGGPSTSVIGCADTPVCNQPPFSRSVLALSAEAELAGVLGETLAHERGHNACLQHVTDHECQLMAGFQGGGCLDALECSRVQDEAQSTSGTTCSCHTDAGFFEADGGTCSDIVTGLCSGGVCGELGSDASVRLLASGGPEALSTGVPDDALAISALTGGWRFEGAIGAEVTGLAYAPSRDVVYGLTAADALVTVNPETGAILTTVASLPAGVRYNALAFDPGPTGSPGDDRLLAMRTDQDCVDRDCFGPNATCDDDLVELDPDTGNLSGIVDICDAFCGGFQGLAYDTQNDRLVGTTFETTLLFEIGLSNTTGFPCQFPDPVTDTTAVAPLIPSALAYHEATHRLYAVGSPLPGPQLAYNVVDPDSFEVVVAHGIDGFTPGGLAALPVPEPAAAMLAVATATALGVACSAARRRRA